MKKKTKAKAAAKKQPKEAEAVHAPKVADYERKRTEVAEETSCALEAIEQVVEEEAAKGGAK